MAKAKNRSTDTAPQASDDSGNIPSRNQGESTDDYVQRILGGFNAASGGRYNTQKLASDASRYGSKLGLEGQKYASDKTYLGTQYGSDQQRIASMYGSDAQREASKYGSDQSRIGSEYASDASRQASMYGADQGLAGTRLTSEASRYGADQSRIGNEYGADQNRISSEYGADAARQASMYGADQGLAGTRLTSEASRYGADQGLAGQRYTADVQERNNQRDAGNQFLQNYAALSSRPSNYFQASEMLHNGIGAGVGSVVDDAMKTGTVQGGAFNQTRGVGNASQQMFGQGTVRPNASPMPSSSQSETGASTSTDLSGQTSSSGHTADSPMATTQPAHQFEQGGGYGGYPWRWGHYDQGGEPMMIVVRPMGAGGHFDQGGRPHKFGSYLGGLNNQFSYDGTPNVASSALTDWQRESGRQNPNLNDPTDKANFEQYVTDWNGVRQQKAQQDNAAQSAADSQYHAASNPPLFNPNPYGFDQGGGDWGTPDAPADSTASSWTPDDTFAGADQQRLAAIDKATQAGVAKWDPNYWQNLDDDTKDLYRSGWNYLGYSARGLEGQIADSRAGNQLGAGRLA